MHFGIDFPVVNGRLNRTVGVPGIDAATIDQLEQRLRVAKRWLDTGEDSHVYR
jgi:hypothetical protein